MDFVDKYRRTLYRVDQKRIKHELEVSCIYHALMIDSVCIARQPLAELGYLGRLDI